MKTKDPSGKWASAGLISAIAASLCCIAPLLAVTAGVGGLASSFSWIEPARPYLIVISIVVLGFAWYKQFKPKLKDECGCEVDSKSSFLQGKKFLLLITIFAIAMMAFPYYSSAFFSKDETQVNNKESLNNQSVEFKIAGMTCNACEEHVKREVNKLEGIRIAEISYKNSNAIIEFDSTKTNLIKITNAIKNTGYEVTLSTIKKQ